MGGKEACIKPHNEWLHPPWFTLSFNTIERKPDQLWNSVRYMTRHATSARKQESGCWRRRTTKTAKEGLGIKMRCLFFFFLGVFVFAWHSSLSSIKSRQVSIPHHPNIHQYTHIYIIWLGWIGFWKVTTGWVMVKTVQSKEGKFEHLPEKADTFEWKVGVKVGRDVVFWFVAFRRHINTFPSIHFPLPCPSPLPPRHLRWSLSTSLYCNDTNELGLWCSEAVRAAWEVWIVINSLSHHQGRELFSRLCFTLLFF